MLPENINWDGVSQSIVDTWLPLIGVMAAIIVVAVVVRIIKKKREK
jgi:TRAP-type C4-dicarboxylate transport system permease small subunit